MGTAKRITIMVWIISLVCQSLVSAEYSLNTSEGMLTFVPQPHLGYVIQGRHDNTAEIQKMTLNLSVPGTIRQSKISGRSELSVIINETEELKNLDLGLTTADIKYSAPLFSVNGQTVAVLPEIVVRITGDNQADLKQQCELSDLSIKQQMAFSNQEYLLDVTGADANAVFGAVEQLMRLSYVEWAAPNLAFKPMLLGQVIPNDTYFSKQWHLNNTGQSGGKTCADVNAPEAWTITTGDPNIVIAVLDTGVDVHHPDLVANIVAGYDFVDDDNIPIPATGLADNAHGTMCAGLAAACGNNKIGVCGVAWNCKIMPVRIADANSFITDADIATAIRWAAEHGADILSNSWGATYLSESIHSAIQDVTRQGGIGRNGKGCIVVGAAGNDGGNVLYPAAYPSVIAVGATDNSDNHWYYSNFGPELDIVAPSGGVREDYFLYGKAFLWTTDITGIYGYSMYNLDISMLDYSDIMSGTSGACPLVAGAAALVLSVKPNLTSTQVKRILCDSSVDLGTTGYDEYYGYGRLDAGAAVNMALNLPDDTSSLIIIYVDDNAPGDPAAGDPAVSDPNEDGTPDHPFDSIQKAIDAAFLSETILVADGTYNGWGNHDIDFDGKNVKVISVNGPNNCIIDCQNLGRGFYFHNAEEANAVLEGLTITNGKAIAGGGIICMGGSNPTMKNLVLKNNSAYMQNDNYGYGGGIYTDSDCNPVITDCNFIDNSAESSGGGLLIYYGSPTINNCIFNSNYAEFYGGGVFNEGGSSAFDECVFSENIANQGDGGAFYNDYYASVIFADCRFGNNSSGYWGGAICDYWGYLNLTNCILYGNSAVVAGGGMYFEVSFATIMNCTFTSNTSVRGYGFACDSSFRSSIQITSSILWDNVNEIYNNDHSLISVTYSDVRRSSGTWTGTGNKNMDPLFANTAKGDYHLKSKAGRWDPISKSWVIDAVHSPCIDTGNPVSDWSGELWPHGMRINMGAYGGTAQASMSLSNIGDIRDLNGDDLVNWDDVLLIADNWNSEDIPSKEDLNRNGRVDVNDLIFYYGNWSADANNAVPVFDTLDNQVGSVGSLLSFPVTANDNDDDSLLYTAFGLPEGAAFFENVFSWTPSQPGTYNIIFVVSDNKSLNYITITITIAANTE
jgi:thermitase